MSNDAVFKCKICGTHNNITSTHCEKCGSDLNLYADVILQSEVADTPVSMVEIVEDAKKGGEYKPEVQPPVTKKPETEKPREKKPEAPKAPVAPPVEKKSNVVVIAIATTLAVVIAMVAAVVFVVMNNEENPKKNKGGKSGDEPTEKVTVSQGEGPGGEKAEIDCYFCGQKTDKIYSYSGYEICDRCWYNYYYEDSCLSCNKEVENAWHEYDVNYEMDFAYCDCGWYGNVPEGGEADCSECGKDICDSRFVLCDEDNERTLICYDCYMDYMETNACEYCDTRVDETKRYSGSDICNDCYDIFYYADECYVCDDPVENAWHEYDTKYPGKVFTSCDCIWHGNVPEDGECYFCEKTLHGNRFLYYDNDTRYQTCYDCIIEHFE